MRLTYAIVTVSDMKRSVAFYRDVLELPLRFESPGWSEFATDGATVALHASTGTRSVIAAASAVDAGTCRPDLGVAALDDFHRRMVERSVTCVQEPKATWGVRIAQYLDPDGLVISVSEERRAK